MPEILRPLHTLPLSELTTERAVRFETSPLATHPDTQVLLNDKFDLSRNPAELLQYLWMPGYGEWSEKIPFFGSGPGTRGREIGDAGYPFFITNKSTGYQDLGILTLKAGGMRWLDKAIPEIEGMTHPASAGVSGINESLRDIGFGDMLDDEGAVVGNTVAIIRTSKEAYLQHYEAGHLVGEHGQAYAAKMRQSWEDDHEYRPSINMQIRHTDPERMAFGFFTQPPLLITSADWMKVELAHNSTPLFVEHYDLPSGYVDHLLQPVDDAQYACGQARLLAYTLIRNFALAKRLQLDASFKLKEMGNLGKLHDFSVVKVDETGQLPRAHADFAHVLETEIRRPDSLLSRTEVNRILEDVMSHTQIDLTQYLQPTR